MPLTANIEALPVSPARAGDASAWDILFQRYQLPLYSFVAELVRDEQAALDIVQETFINAVRYLHSLRDDEKFGSWLFGIAHQRCIQLWRRKRKDDGFFNEEVHDDLVGDAEPPDEVLIRREDETAFMALIETLPFAHRTVLLLHYLEDFPLEQIAEATETNLGTVKSRLHYAKKALRKLIKEQP